MHAGSISRATINLTVLISLRIVSPLEGSSSRILTRHFVHKNVRNTVLVDKLRRLASQYENVKEIGLVDGIVGDIGFLDHLKPYHAFMVCEPFKVNEPTNAPKIYAHSTSRCCDRMDTNWKHWFSTMFRLEDG